MIYDAMSGTLTQQLNGFSIMLWIITSASISITKQQLQQQERRFAGTTGI